MNDQGFGSPVEILMGVGFIVWISYSIWRAMTSRDPEPEPRDPGSLTYEPLLTNLSLEEARAEADRSLADPALWLCSPPAPVVRQVRFGPELEGFFRRFSKVEAMEHEALIEDGEPVNSFAVAGLLLIGHLQEHSEICAKEDSDEIMVFYTDDPDLAPNTFPSIYHLICGIDRGEIC